MKERRASRRSGLKTGELIELNQEKLPGCYFTGRSHDVARTEHLTVHLHQLPGDAGQPTTDEPREAYAKARWLLHRCHEGPHHVRVPFAMGPVGSPFSKIGVELTDSIYVVSTCASWPAWRRGDGCARPQGEFTKCLHSKADLDVNRRLILHFPEDNAIWSVGSGYGGNVSARQEVPRPAHCQCVGPA